MIPLELDLADVVYFTGRFLRFEAGYGFPVLQTAQKHDSQWTTVWKVGRATKVVVISGKSGYPTVLEYYDPAIRETK